VKSEDREQFNSFQEICDEVVQMESENQTKGEEHDARPFG
jgi:hypothetical protein